MYIDSCTTKGKYTRHLLRESFREDGKVKHRTIANLSHCSAEEIAAIRLALKHKDDLAELATVTETVTLRQGLSVGAVWLVHDIARRLGIAEALGPSREGKLALWQVIARVIDQGSRLSAVRLAGGHAACDILGLQAFNEDDLYANLDWLCENQPRIEDRLFRKLHDKAHPDGKPGLFLYDVTSSYLEGECNELAAFGYNRDGKKGKRQIVVGLLCDGAGSPLSIEVFAGNTRDPATLAPQIKKAADRFGGGEVTFVGDRGMIKSREIEDLTGHGFHYITAITKPQIEALLAKDVFQMSLFDQDLAEVVTDTPVRYILRRNPVRADEVRKTRESKLASVRREAKKQTEYLAAHPRARVDVALRKMTERIKRLKLSKWLSAAASGREIALSVDGCARAEAEKLDGCYVLKTDLTPKAAGKETVHARYKDLAMVEWAFRTAKTVELEMRPLYLRRAGRTRAHAFVVMLAYRIVRELASVWRDIDATVEEGVKELATLCATEMLVDGKPRSSAIPKPRPSVRKLLAAAKMRLPDALSCKGIRVATRKKLAANRKSR